MSGKKNLALVIAITALVTVLSMSAIFFIANCLGVEFIGHLDESIHGNYKSVDESAFQVLDFDDEQKQYYLYDHGELLKKDTFKSSELPNVYLLKDMESEKYDYYFVMEKDKCYLILDGKVSLFKKESRSLVHFGEMN